MLVRTWTKEDVKDLCNRYDLKYFVRNSLYIIRKDYAIILSIRIDGPIREDDKKHLATYNIFLSSV